MMKSEDVSIVMGVMLFLVLLVSLFVTVLDDIQVNDLGDLKRVPVYVVTVDGEVFVCASAPGITASKVVLHDCNFLKSRRAAYAGYLSVNVEARMPERVE